MQINQDPPINVQNAGAAQPSANPRRYKKTANLALFLFHGSQRENND